MPEPTLSPALDGGSGCKPGAAPAPLEAGTIEWFPQFWVRGAGFPFAHLLEVALPAAALERMEHPDCDADERDRLFNAEAAAARDRLRTCLTAPMAMEAVYLSNPDSADRVSELAGEDLGKLRQRTRQKLRLAWSYLQRFCAKNDTASFFGPVAWGRFDPRLAQALKVEGGAGLKERRVLFEIWVAEALAQALEQDPGLRPHLPVILNPGCCVVPQGLSIPIDRTVRLPDPVLAALARMPEVDWNEASACVGLTEDEAAAWHERLLKAGVLLSSARAAPGDLTSLKTLALALPEHPAAERWRVALDHLETLRAKFETGGLAARKVATQAMNEILAGLGIDRARQKGRMYVGRFAVYEDCGRDLFVTVGRPLLDAITEALAPLLVLYQAVARVAARRLETAARAHFERLGGTEECPVGFLALLAAVRAEDPVPMIAKALQVELEAAWEAELPSMGPDLDALLTQALAQRLARRMDAGQDFPTALGIDLASPDIMIAADSVEAVCAGRYRLILGEVHPAVVTAAQPIALPFCPDPQEVAAVAQRWLERPRLQLADSTRGYQRSHILWPSGERLAEVVLPGDRSRLPHDHQIPSGRCRVVLRDEKLLVEDAASPWRDDLVTLLASDLHRVLFACARAVQACHRPGRLVAGQMILKRRTWDLTAAVWPSKPAEQGEDFLAVRRWAKERGLPRFVFAKSDQEPKPVFIDFDNPLAVDALVRLGRAANALEASEMSPEPGEFWLAGPGGAVCAELRLSTRLIGGEDE